MPATDDNRPIKLTTPFGGDVLLFSQLSGSERLSQPFQFELSLLSENGDLDGNKILGCPVAVTFPTDSGNGERVFHGLVSDFTQLSYGVRHHEYQVTLRPWFWFLSRTADCRVYQNMTVQEIFDSLAREHGFSDFRFALKGSYKKLAYCVQYRETAFNFLSRLLEQEGIYFFFEHTEQKHTMVLVDDSASHKEIAGYAKVPYYPPSLPQTRRVRDHLTSWTHVRTVQPGSYATTDYDFKKPATSLLKSHAIKRQHAAASFEIFDYPAELPAKRDDDGAALEDSAESARIARIRIEELQSGHLVAHGQGNATGLAAGAQFELTDFPRTDLNVKYIVVAASYSLASNAYETGASGDAQFHVAVEAIDARTQFRPPRVTPKPVVQGAQTATVVGKSGEEIDTDEYGRVKVQFHWDRKGSKDDKSSCRVRVAQVWAGQQWGAIHIPRIGQEVIVSFLEGDPDRPIITGRVYNGMQKPPYGLPANATQSGIKSRSSKGGNDKTFNEIRFEDKKGSEELVLHAEKDFKVDVENDATWRVGLDEDSPAKNEKGQAKMLIGKTLHVDVGDMITFETGDSKIVMKKNGDIDITCKNLTVKASDAINLKADKEVQINGQQKVGVKSLDVKVEGTTAVAVKGLKVEVEGTTLVGIKSSLNTKVEGMMLDLSGSAIASLKGALTKIG
jgi:type VI secretion system secreted protein VgrG